MCLLLVLFCMPSTARGEKIRTVVPQSNLNYLSVYVAESKGFFNQEGLENETRRKRNARGGRRGAT